MTGPVSGNSTQVWFEGEARAYQAGVRDERERIRQLADDHDARCWEKPGHTWQPSAPDAKRIPFADLLTEGTTT